MGTLREETINSVKRQIATYSITQEDLGYMPRVETRVEKVPDEEFIEAVKTYIQSVEEVECARECFPEKYWEQLDIVPEKKYTVVNVKVQKTISQIVRVAVPEDCDCFSSGTLASDIVEQADLSVLDDNDSEIEEDWYVEDTDIEEQDMTADQVRHEYGGDLFNADDFDEE